MAEEGILVVEIRHRGRLVPARAHLLASDGTYRYPSGCLPYDKDKHFTTEGAFTATLPCGETSILVEKGKEFVPIDDLLDIRAGEETSRRYDLRRWVDMAKLGWYSGDTHVHRPLGDMLHLMEAEDLNAASVITVWNQKDEWKGRTIPNRRVVRKGRRAYGILSQEDERAGGAVIALDPKNPVRMMAGKHFPPGAAYCREWRRGGATIEQEKPFWWEAPVNVALRLVDTIGVVNNHLQRTQVMDNEAWGRERDRTRYPGKEGFVQNVLDLYYGFLNLGLRIPLTAGSASGVLRNPLGYNRLYVYLGRSFGYRRWFDGMKSGKAFATNGPMLILRIDGSLPGLTLTYPRSVQVTVEIVVLSFRGLDRVELVKNGEVIESSSSEGRSSEHEKVVLSLDESCWIAARAFERSRETVRFAHSNPVFLEIGGAMLPSRLDAEYFARWCRELSAKIRGELRASLPEGELRELVDLYERAARFYDALAERPRQGDRRRELPRKSQMGATR